MNIELLTFLSCPTPIGWLDFAKRNIPLLLIDHANCEKKAASSALQLTYRYIEKTELLLKFSRLAREEMHHFEQVVALMAARNIHYAHLSASRYAGELKRYVRQEEPGRLVDTLLVGAIIEARSCERFAALAPVLDEELGSFYSSLLKSESRHFFDYLKFAEMEASNNEIRERLEVLIPIEQSLIQSGDMTFRFHSGDPTSRKDS